MGRVGVSFIVLDDVRIQVGEHRDNSLQLQPLRPDPLSIIRHSYFVIRDWFFPPLSCSFFPAIGRAGDRRWCMNRR
jgi:hypothetical protein